MYGRALTGTKWANDDATGCDSRKGLVGNKKVDLAFA